MQEHVWQVLHVLIFEVAMQFLHAQYEQQHALRSSSGMVPLQLVILKLCVAGMGEITCNDLHRVQ